MTSSVFDQLTEHQHVFDSVAAIERFVNPKFERVFDLVTHAP